VNKVIVSLATTRDNPLTCPICGHDFTHVRGVYVKEGYEATLGSGIQREETDGFRGDGLAIILEGECSHWFEVIYRQHKGQTFVYHKQIERLKSVPDFQFAGLGELQGVR
jgi:hypothetical protein